MRHFLLAAGVNYADLRLNSLFLDCLKLRTEFLVQQHRGKVELTLTLFDFTSGRNTKLLVDQQYKVRTSLVWLDAVNASLPDNEHVYPQDLPAALKPEAGDFR